GFGNIHTPLDKAMVDYLRKWILYGWEYRELLRNIPAVSIPDDHDVYHGNLWGEGGKKAKATGTAKERQDSGGYKLPADFVKMVERTQTSNLPDPYDPTPIKQGIGVYYTEMNYGGLSFAVIEDRKFKSSPANVLPEEAEVSNGWAENKNWDVRNKSDVSGAVLLGERQEAFLKDWGSNWSEETTMKVLLSQTIFSNVATLPKKSISDVVVPKLRILKKGDYAPDDVIVSDMDSNGWPHTARNTAVDLLRKCFAFHLAGDQHLGTTIHYGIDDWKDGGVAVCVPSISNYYPRRWFPNIEGENRPEGAPKYAGDFIDGFNNYLTVYAVSNPVFTGKKPSKLYDRSAGYGIVKFNKTSRDIAIELWPRDGDPTDPNSKPYEDWPVKINQLDNYGRQAYGYLPKIVT
ncbi:MAG: alkaline phosphatase D family protein, partial [Cyclobacteriaceae bacterium]|nr:alkaline phosphatase D family protein [Cyclobacteriaceae bacterium]